MKLPQECFNLILYLVYIKTKPSCDKDFVACEKEQWREEGDKESTRKGSFETFSDSFQ